MGGKMLKRLNPRPLIRSFCRKNIRVIRVAWSKANDFCLNIETSDVANSLHPSRYGLPNDVAIHKDGNGYQATDYRNIRHIIRILKPARDDVFYDLGCGKGRASVFLPGWRSGGLWASN